MDICLLAAFAKWNRKAPNEKSFALVMMKNILIFAFVMIGSITSMGLVYHLFQLDKDEAGQHTVDPGNEKVELNFAKRPPETDKDRSANHSGTAETFDSGLNGGYRENEPEKHGKNDHKSEIGKSWYDDGKPGASRAELDSMHEYQAAMIEKEWNDPDAIVIEATDDHAAVTRAELEALHAEQMGKIREDLDNPDAIVIEATDDQPAVTRGELQALHDEQIHQINEKLSDPDSIAIEAADNHPAVTRCELAALHEEQQQQTGQKANDPDEAAIENEDGSFITHQELLELHEKQEYEILKSQFDGEEVLLEDGRSNP